MGTETKIAFEGLISRSDTDEQKNSELEEMSMKMSKIEMQKERKGTE